MTSTRIIHLWPDGSENNGPDPAWRPHLEVHPPPKARDVPTAAVLVLPGGGYNNLAPHEGANFARLLADHGMVGIVCHYRRSPNRFPAPQADAARAVRMVRSMAGELNIDPQRVGMLGFSAGGHNAATIATQPLIHRDPHDDLLGQYGARPDRLMLGYPVISFVQHAHAGCVKALLGESPSQGRLEALSNELHVTPDNPPTFIFHTVGDAGVPVEHALLFAGALRAAGVAFELHCFEPGLHGVGMALTDRKLRSWSDLMMNWLSDWWG
jgi:acetyl esterase/lipase